MIEGFLLDIDGVLAVSWEPIQGAVDTLAALRSEGMPFRLITNTTTGSRAELAQTLRGAGFDVQAEEIVTAVLATAQHLRTQHPGARCFVLSDGDPGADLEGIERVGPEDADVVVIGGAGEGFTHDVLNRVFRRLVEGAPLVAMHRNLYWRTAGGLELDGGAYIVALEAAAGVVAEVCGKPSPPFFRAALATLGVSADRTAMVGDDVVNDVLGAQAVGLVGVLVRTGKFREQDLEKGPVDHVLDSVADLPRLLGRYP